jgi:hypothetical protein
VKTTDRGDISSDCVERALILFFVLLMAFAVSAKSEAAGGYMPWVFVSCGCDDIVGGNLCYSVKEKIRASAGFKLSDQPREIGIAVHMVCIDDSAEPEDRGKSSAVSVTFTTYTNSTSTLEFYETGTVMVVGASRVDEMATSVVSEIDKVATDNSTFFALGQRRRSSGSSK